MDIKEIGTVGKVQGAASVRHPDGSEEALRPGMAVHQGDEIRTGADGGVGVTLVDKSALSLGPKGSLSLDEMVFDPADLGSGHAVLTAHHGTFSVVSGMVAKTVPGAMQLKTPVMTIGIRGTTVAGQAGGEGQQNSIVLLPDPDGTVGEIVVSNAGGSVVLNSPMTGLSLSSSLQPPPPPTALTPQQIQGMYGGALAGQPVPPALPPQPPPPAPSQGGDQGAQFLDGTGGPEQDPQPPAEVGAALGQLVQLVAQGVLQASGTLGALAAQAAADQAAFQDFLAGLDDNNDDTNNQIDEVLDQLAQVNVVYGTPNSDSLTGTDGVDWFYPGLGGDTIDALAGDDVIFASADVSYDTFYGGDGNDTISYVLSAGGMTIDLGDQFVSGNGDYDGLNSIENASGSNDDDVIVASSVANTIYGNGGDDIIKVTLDMANDLFDGGAGTDTLSFENEVQSVEVSLDNGSFSYVADDMQTYTDTIANFENLTGGSGDDLLVGDNGANVLRGNAGADMLDGAAGNDTLYDGSGTDVLAGGDGDDSIVLSADGEADVVMITGSSVSAAGTDTISGFVGGSDTIEIDSALFTGLNFGNDSVSYAFTDLNSAKLEFNGNDTYQIVGIDNSSGAVDLYYITADGDSYQIATIADTSTNDLSSNTSVVVT